MVYPQYTLKNESSLVLVGESREWFIQKIVDPSNVSVAVGNVHMQWTIDLNKHLNDFCKQLSSCFQVACENKRQPGSNWWVSFNYPMLTVY